MIDRLREIEFFELFIGVVLFIALAPIVIMAGLMLIHLLMFGNMGISTTPSTTPSQGPNEFCRTETHFSHFNHVGKVMVPVYTSKTICITPIPR